MKQISLARASNALLIGLMLNQMKAKKLAEEQKIDINILILFTRL